MTPAQVEEAARLGVVFTERDGLTVATAPDGEAYYLDHADQIAPMLQDVRARQDGAAVREYCSRCDRPWNLDVHGLCRVAGESAPDMPCGPVPKPNHAWRPNSAYGSGSGGVTCERCGAWTSTVPPVGPCEGMQP